MPPDKISQNDFLLRTVAEQAKPAYFAQFKSPEMVQNTSKWSNTVILTIRSTRADLSKPTK